MENTSTYDFCGWATRANVKCSDGRTIMKHAFKDCCGKKVPLVWNHQHTSPDDILGHALLEDRDGDVYAYCSFNDSELSKKSKILVEHGDIVSLSILANQLTERNKNVIHGTIREVSLVLAGANPEAYIDNIMTHSDEDGESATIYFGQPLEPYIEHADNSKTEKENEKMPDNQNNKIDTGKEETIQDVFNTLTEKQKTVVYALIGQALDDTEKTQKEEGDKKSMKHNVFENGQNEDATLIHSELESAVIGDAKRFGSMKESMLQHGETYGITDIDYLFPEAKSLTTTPEFLKRDNGWVSTVMNGVHRSPFSRIKSVFADIREDEARAKGYIKGKLKKEEVFSLLKRATTPTTVYKKQKMDRDDVIDITDFDAVAWVKGEMRMMLDEEIARAILVGDGRLASDDDKINESNIRPIWKDSELFTIKANFTVSGSATADDKAKAFIRTCIKARKDYKGSGNPTLYTTEDILTDCLLLTDETGRDLYESVDKLATKLRVKNIVTVPVMEGLTREGTSSDKYELFGLIVNPADYNVGADKGGSINMFEDFDIDYNQMKYLIETRCSGALTKPYSAIAVELKTTGG